MRSIKNETNLLFSKTASCIPEDLSRLVILKSDQQGNDIELIIKALKKDQVVLIKDIEPEQADTLMSSISAKFGLSKSLELQAAFASSLGHRKNIGKYYMSVNERSDYQFVTPHSEGSSFVNIQLASFYCHENSTDGGETILFNIDPDCGIWGGLREQVKRGKSKTPLSPGDIRKIKAVARLRMPEDTLKVDDEILEQSSFSPNFTVFNALTKPTKSHSLLLNREVYVYWDTTESVDCDSALEFNSFLRKRNLLKLPHNNLDVENLDDSTSRRIRHFGSNYEQLFKSTIVHKLQPGEFIIQNNLTWCHSVNNWTPGSGIRKVVAAFA